MTRDQKQIARTKFQNKLLSSNKQAFEDLFTKVMQLYDKNFQPVKPHGREGDKKCDGVNKVTGQFYQVYAPEDLKGKDKITSVKLGKTIEGLFSYWPSISTINEFYFVLNDNYNGVPPAIHQQLSEIATKYQIKADTILCKDLEDIFLQLHEDDIIEILGGSLPSAANITNIDISSLGEVIDHLLNSEIKPKEERFPNDPNFDKKIKFNKLSEEYAEQLRVAYLQTYIIFEKIWEETSPRNTMPFRNAALVLMSHYFESCDIFEEPVEPTQQSLFE
jgi:hypothetical protein